jgi:hypothetical protein
MCGRLWANQPARRYPRFEGELRILCEICSGFRSSERDKQASRSFANAQDFGSRLPELCSSRLENASSSKANRRSLAKRARDFG